MLPPSQGHLDPRNTVIVSARCPIRKVHVSVSPCLTKIQLTVVMDMSASSLRRSRSRTQKDDDDDLLFAEPVPYT
jgi:hypothetical protein